MKEVLLVWFYINPSSFVSCNTGWCVIRQKQLSRLNWSLLEDYVNCNKNRYCDFNKLDFLKTIVSDKRYTVNYKYLHEFHSQLPATYNDMGILFGFL